MVKYIVVVDALTNLAPGSALIEAVRSKLVGAKSASNGAVERVIGWIWWRSHRINVERFAFLSVGLHVDSRPLDAGVVAPLPANGASTDAKANYSVGFHTPRGQG